MFKHFHYKTFLVRDKIPESVLLINFKTETGVGSVLYRQTPGRKNIIENLVFCIP